MADEPDSHRRYLTDEQIDAYRQRLRPWVQEPTMEYVIRIEAELVTGFELVHAGPPPRLDGS